jgi:chaperonin cofactor prefoldin
MTDKKDNPLIERIKTRTKELRRLQQQEQLLMSQLPEVQTKIQQMFGAINEIAQQLVEGGMTEEQIKEALDDSTQ